MDKLMNSAVTDDSVGFYDKYVTRQIESGINDRIFSLFQRLKKIGLSEDSKVLEIGCGIGNLTYLLSKKIDKGCIEALDLSPKSIEFAKSKIRKNNVFFSVSEIENYVPKTPLFDKILLFDVIEHIPEDTHQVMFSKISAWMHDDTMLLINIPNPKYIQYCEKYEPEGLQFIDQPIFIESIVSNLKDSGLEIVHFEKYGVWMEGDYNFIIIKKRGEFTRKLFSNKRNIAQKALYRIKHILRKRIYQYP